MPVTLITETEELLLKNGNYTAGRPSGGAMPDIILQSPEISRNQGHFRVKGNALFYKNTGRAILTLNGKKTDKKCIRVKPGITIGIGSLNITCRNSPESKKPIKILTFSLLSVFIVGFFLLRSGKAKKPLREKDFIRPSNTISYTPTIIGEPPAESVKKARITFLSGCRYFREKTINPRNLNLASISFRKSAGFIREYSRKPGWSDSLKLMIELSEAVTDSIITTLAARAALEYRKYRELGNKSSLLSAMRSMVIIKSYFSDKSDKRYLAADRQLKALRKHY
ncbi:MAG: FHA domain-containing protein [Fibrobacterota bacterium]